MEPVNLLLVGCGTMGVRHVRGFAELEAVRPGGLRLLAVCDRRREAAEQVASLAEEVLGARPQVFTGAAEAVAGEPSLDAVDVVTDPRTHDELVIALLEAGLPVLVEKPLAVTVARGRRMVEAAERTGRSLAVAENNRRDPMNRLAKACLQAGLIGAPNFILQTNVLAGGRAVVSPWRHHLAMGGLGLDVGVHYAYIQEYLLGPMERVSGQAQQIETEREWTPPEGTSECVVVDSEDVLAALTRFTSGVQGQWTMHFASAGETLFKRLLFGAEGTLNGPPDRSGQPVVVQRRDEILSGEALLAALPDYHLNDIEARLFGERPAEYKLSGPETDRKLIAAEVEDFLGAVRTGGAPEVDGALGLRAVAIIYALLESAACGSPVRVEDVLSGAVADYQARVEAAG